MRRLLLALGLVLAAPKLVLAQASVVVEVRDPAGAPADGRVTLSPEGSTAPAYSCQTHAGSCTIAGVAGGRYVVRLEPGGGGAGPEPRVVMIPPSGSATLRVSTH